MALKFFLAISLIMMSSVNAFEYLVLAPFPFRDEWFYMETFIHKLLTYGHHVTAITPYKLSTNSKSDPFENYKEIRIPEYNLNDVYSSKKIFTGNFESDIYHIQALYKIGLHVSEHALNNSEVKRFIKRSDKNFDLVLADHALQESLFMFAKKFDCPLVTIGANRYSGFVSDSFRQPSSISYVPHPVSSYDTDMTYLQRCYNALLYLYEGCVRKFSYIPQQNKLARKYFRDGIEGDIPHVMNIVRDISASLVSSHRFLEYSPRMPGQIDITGSHIKPKENLPNDLLEAIDNTEHSTIYFSLGSFLKPSEMPKEKLNELIKVFKSIKELILWKYDDDKIPAGLPENVIVRKWFPQNDILANKAVVLFITNGGTLSFQESLHHGSPMIVIPFTGEQYRNGLRAERGRFGKMIQFDDLNAEVLLKTIKEIMDDKSYFSNVRKAANAYLSGPSEPLRDAIFWINNIAGNKGVTFMKPEALFSPWYRFYGYDVAALYFAIILICALFWIFTIKLIVSRYRKKQERGKFKYY